MTPAPPAAQLAPAVWWHWLLLCGLAALQVCTALGMAGTPDTLRDMYFAQQLATGAQWPLDGPVIYNTLHLGPLWYYLLGASLWLLPFPLTVPATIALVAALKYLLAYLIGRRYGGAQLGLLFVLASFAPGWSSFALAAMTHTTAVEAAVLFGLWSSLYYRDRPGPARALVLGLAATAMLHAHPTTLLLGSLFVLHALSSVDKWTCRLRDLAVVGLIGLLSLMPMLIAQVQAGYTDLATLQGYAARDPAAPTLTRLAAMLLSLAGYGADYAARYWLELTPGWRRALMAAHLSGLAACLVAAVHAQMPQRRQLAWTLLALLPLQSFFVLALRPVTPYWMLFAHLPLLALLVALGLQRLLQAGRAARWLTWALLALWSGSSLAIHWTLAHPASEALLPLARPGQQGLMDAIQHLTGAERHTILLLPLQDRYAITAPLCVPTTLYAHYAEFIDQSLGVGLLARCGHRNQVQIGGPPQGQALLGLRDHAWAQIGETAPQRLAHLGYTPIGAIWHAGSPSPAAVPGLFPAHPGLAVSPRDFVVNGKSAAGELVVVAHRAAFYEPFAVTAASAGGEALQPLYRDQITAIYRAPRDRGDAVDWTLNVHATPDHVDVVTLPPATASAP
ncbi:hypothetical protein DFR29_116145 [Tahibacter aquaticus]|uniref:Dolichyl-phosphate-mannose-protein mannosyltransferase n=1 Tax=Tahibacter aquaticus TaxID=520092 RepID=A0A4R6YP34_9GAMM|nr:hypothetical protein [Tahibacter aquaticus]TDR39443.1 hypothetical protein DFR29_116145 [Tahibacter aquaticus]